MEAAPVTAIAYIRVSSQRQVTDGNSLVVQRNLVTRYAEHRGYRLIHIFVEEAESAKTDDRPTYQDMRAKLASGAVKAAVLIIPKIDRLARNRDDYGTIKKALTRFGVRLESCSEVLEDTPSGRLTESMLASIAQFDNEVRAERSRDGMIQAVHEGRWVWKAPLGYRNIRLKTGKKGGLGTIEPDEPMASLMREVFERIASQRQDVRQVRDWLENRGVNIAHGNMYHLLKNPVYRGSIVAFGSEFEAKPPFVPLVSGEQFALVQAIIKKNPNLPTVYDHDNPDYPLRGCLRCELCKRFLTAAWSTGKYNRFPYYRCLSCQHMNLSRDRYEELFVAELALFRPDPSTVVKLKAGARANYERATAEQLARKSELTIEIARTADLRRQVALKTAGGIIPDDVGKEQLDALSAEMGRIQEELRKTTPAPDQVLEALSFVERFFEDLALHWKRIGVSAQKKLQAFFFPEGLVAEKTGNLRTSDYPLLEQVKSVFRGEHYALVDQTFELPSDVIRFILRLREEFDVDSPTVQEIEVDDKINRAA